MTGHLRDDRVDEVEGRFEVHGDNRVPLGLAHPHHEAVLGDAGVVDEDVDAAEVLEDLLDDGVRLVEVGRVGGVTLDLMPESGDLGDGLLGRFVDDKIGEGDVRAFFCEFECDGLSDASCSAGDQGHLSF